MAKAHAAGKLAFGFCDRCGFRYDLNELRQETINQVLVNIRTCPKCWDEDHPQYRVGRRSYHDPQALLNPRPDNSQDESRYGISVRYDFDSDVDGWTPQAGATLAYISSENAGLGSGGAVNLSSNSASGITRDSDSKINLDPTIYKIVRIRLRSIVETNKDQWRGRLRWQRDIDSNFANQEVESIDRPVFEQMGEKYHVLSYDLSNHAKWTDTIEMVQFGPYSDNGGASTVYIDYIRFEKP